MDMDDNNKLVADLKEKILHLSKFAWDARIDWTDVKKWLSNFSHNSGPQIDGDQLQMLHVLSQFMYFGGRELRELLKCIYRDKYRYFIVEKIRQDNGDSTDSVLIKQKYLEELSKTKFLGMGNPSESGTHLLYYFRQEAGLGKNHFINSHEVIKRSGGATTLRDATTKYYVFIDDLCGSGDQACQYSKDIVEEIKHLNPDAIVIYYVIFAMKAGIDCVRKHSSFDIVDCVYELDESFKCFDPNSRHYKRVGAPIDKDSAHKIANHFGNILWRDHPLGYNNCQLLIGFHHNTPDNTLPIIWYSEPNGAPWNPAFKRYSKYYGWGI